MEGENFMLERPTYSGATDSLFPGGIFLGWGTLLTCKKELLVI